jgi:osmotically-inducible protein OsmY
MANWLRNFLCLAVVLTEPLGAPRYGSDLRTQEAVLLALRTPLTDEDRADWKLALKIRNLLAQDSDLGPLNLTVQVRRGVVTLSGPVPSDLFRRRAEALVRAVNGVREVRNELSVRTPLPDMELRPKGNPLIPPVPLPPLIGPPQSRATFSRPSQNAPSHVPKAVLASRVEADLGTEDCAKQGVATRSPASIGFPQTVSEADVRFSVERLLRNNPRFREVRADVERGTVRLRGTVANPADRDDLLAGVRPLAPGFVLDPANVTVAPGR